jgi:hypothetical protein
MREPSGEEAASQRRVTKLLVTTEGAVVMLNPPVTNCCVLRINEAATALRTPAVGSIGHLAALAASATHATQYDQDQQWADKHESQKRQAGGWDFGYR